MPRSAASVAPRAFAAVALTVVLGAPALRALLGQGAWGVALVLLLVAAILLARRLRPRLRWSRTPKSLVAFAVVALLSLPWSAGGSAGVLALLATGVVGAVVALILDPDGFVTALGRALRILVGLSLVFELVAAVAVRRSVAPLTVAMPEPWSQAALLRGGPIQGLVGDAGLLGLLAVLGLAVVAIELASGRARRRGGVLWLVLFAAALLLSRSGTAALSLAAVVVVAAFALWTRRRGEDRRGVVYVSAAVLLVAIAAGVLLAGGPDLAHVTATSPELGPVALVLLIAVAVSTLWRSWFRAVDPVRVAATSTLPYAPLALAPLLIVVAVLTSSLLEGRVPIEGGWLVLAALAVQTKQPAVEAAPLREAPDAARR
ncbi:MULTISPECIES: hypothetical protein [unclassified Rathayibacter]|uniref:hypothetical protein n=1 Tax=unclassified Rathayibacter TaxID=2609250 RepID=UPI00188A6A7F|nr:MULTISPECIES: hypothetical protein [unclassified Rathayibacter]MBF4463352.1 hypothetical protein [Rathayibacter sp. VKM Ac-2879]MBF4504925.1 hypothetical protein [Rathayibacter sp. VKM Ac-2878]